MPPPPLGTPLVLHNTEWKAPGGTVGKKNPDYAVDVTAPVPLAWFIVPAQSASLALPFSLVLIEVPGLWIWEHIRPVLENIASLGIYDSGSEIGSQFRHATTVQYCVWLSARTRLKEVVTRLWSQTNVCLKVLAVWSQINGEERHRYSK